VPVPHASILRVCFSGAWLAHGAAILCAVRPADAISFQPAKLALRMLVSPAACGHSPLLLV